MATTTLPSDPDAIVRRLGLRELRMLQAVAEHGSMAKAAHRLAVSRPVVSKTIADLERTLGVRLLDRNPQKVEPTVFGRALLRRCLPIFDELRQGVAELRFLSDAESGELRIGASEYMAAGLIPAVIDRLSRDRPGLLFKLELLDPVEQLRERRVEFVIARLLSQQRDPDLEDEVLFHEKVFIAAGRNNKWAGRRKVAIAELAGEPWILAPPEVEPGSPIVEAFSAAGIALPRAKVLGLSLPLRNGLLATGRFLTIVPGSVLRFGAERTLLKVLPVELPPWRLPVAITTVKNRALTPLGDLFLARTRELARCFDEPSALTRRRQ